MVVGALGVRVVGERPLQQGRHALVRPAGYAGVELDAGLRQGGAGPGADAAADQGVHPVALEEARQGAVAAAHGADHLGGGHRAVRRVVQLELLTVAEVLKHLAVFIGYRDFHGTHLACYSTSIVRRFRKKASRPSACKRENPCVIIGFGKLCKRE